MKMTATIAAIIITTCAASAQTIEKWGGRATATWYSQDGTLTAKHYQYDGAIWSAVRVDELVIYYPWQGAGEPQGDYVIRRGYFRRWLGDTMTAREWAKTFDGQTKSSDISEVTVEPPAPPYFVGTYATDGYQLTGWSNFEVMNLGDWTIDLNLDVLWWWCDLGDHGTQVGFYIKPSEVYGVLPRPDGVYGWVSDYTTSSEERR